MLPNPPSDWESRSLFELAEYQNGQAFRPSETKGTGLPIIKIAELNHGIGPSTGRASCEVDPRKVIGSGDLLFAWSGSVGVYKWAGPKAVLNQHIFKVTSREGVDQTFLRYLLEAQLPTFQRVVDDQATTMGHVKIVDLKRLRVIVPPFPQQRAIGRILGSLDDKIELNRRMNQTLGQIAQALFKSWFVDFDPVRAKVEGRWRKGENQPGMPPDMWELWPSEFVESEIGEIPKGWRVVALSELAASVRKTLDPQTHVDDLFEHYSIPAFDEGRTPKIEEGSQILSQKLRVPKASVLISRLNPRIPRIWPVTGSTAVEGIASTEFLVLSPKSPVSVAFLWALCSSVPFTEEFKSLVTGTSGSHQRVPPEDAMSIQTVRPAKQLLTRFDRIAATLLTHGQRSLQDSVTLSSVRDALLPKLLSGKIRVPIEEATA
jgi:type I restriction enzyme S subunit